MSIAPGDSHAAGAPPGAPGRPREIEAASNLYLIHPASRSLANFLATTPVTPNQVSVASVAAAGGAAIAYVAAPPPLGALLGLALQILWHVLDGADGDLARRTGRASPLGELVDGVCDHVSQALIYVAFALLLQRSLGGWAWALAAAAAGSHFLQANAYESGRKAYRRFVYGAPWMRQTGGGEYGFGAALSAFYMAVSASLSPGEARVEQIMDEPTTVGAESERRARQLYRDSFAPLVKASGVLGANPRTVAAFLSILVGRPLWFFLFELTALNLSLAIYVGLRARTNREFASRLSIHQ